jgi:hypothetical protein
MCERGGREDAVSRCLCAGKVWGEVDGEVERWEVGDGSKGHVRRSCAKVMWVKVIGEGNKSREG